MTRLDDQSLHYFYSLSPSLLPAVDEQGNELSLEDLVPALAERMTPFGVHISADPTLPVSKDRQNARPGGPILSQTAFEPALDVALPSAHEIISALSNAPSMSDFPIPAAEHTKLAHCFFIQGSVPPTWGIILRAFQAGIDAETDKQRSFWYHILTLNEAQELDVVALNLSRSQVYDDLVLAITLSPATFTGESAIPKLTWVDRGVAVDLFRKSKLV